MYIPALSGLRGFAALLVFCSHASQRGVLPDVFGHGAGHMGVMLFFTLSAFLMTILYFDKAPTKDSIRKFWIARFSRVYPLHFVLLTIGLLAYYLEVNRVVFPYSIALGTYLENIFLVGRFNVFWTISTEFQFYLLFAILWLVTHRSGRPTLFMSCASGILCLAVLLDNYDFPSGPVHKTIQFFAIGIIAGVLFLRVDFSNFAKHFDALLLLLLALFILSLPIPAALLIGKSFAGFWSPWLLVLCFLIILSCALADGKCANLLGSRIGILLGDLSFAIYLIHIPILHLVTHYFEALPMLLSFLIAFFGVIFGSILIFYLLEKPAQSWIRKQWSRQIQED